MSRRWVCLLLSFEDPNAIVLLFACETAAPGAHSSEASTTLRFQASSFQGSFLSSQLMWLLASFCFAACVGSLYP